MSAQSWLPVVVISPFIKGGKRGIFTHIQISPDPSLLKRGKQYNVLLSICTSSVNAKTVYHNQYPGSIYEYHFIA